MEIKHLVIDMDNTLINFSQGDHQKALLMMSDPSYYKTLKPFTLEDVSLITRLMTDYTITIFSGIPDQLSLSSQDYQTYYESVVNNKLSTLRTYFGSCLDSIQVLFCKQSDSKAKHFKDTLSLSSLDSCLLLDDYSRYCEEWTSLGGLAYQITTDKPLNFYLKKLLASRDDMKDLLLSLQSTNKQLKEMVNHPDHYISKYECIDVMEEVFGSQAVKDFCICNAFKYLWRYKKKNGIEDLKKARWYLDKEIELESHIDIV